MRAGSFIPNKGNRVEISDEAILSFFQPNLNGVDFGEIVASSGNCDYWEDEHVWRFAQAQTSRGFFIILEKYLK